MPVLINLLGFAWCWLALVLGAFYGLAWPALLLLAVWVCLHLYYSRHRASDLKLILAAAALGPLVDCVLLAGGWVAYAGGDGSSAYPPLAMLAHWINFALLLNHSLEWLGRHPHLAPLLGAVAGPVAYLAGTALGALDIGPPLWQPLLLIALGWALIWPVLLRLTAVRA